MESTGPLGKFFTTQPSQYKASTSIFDRHTTSDDVGMKMSVSLVMFMNPLGNLHNNEMASQHHAIRKLATITLYAVGMVFAGIFSGTIEVMARFVIAVIAFPVAIGWSFLPREQRDYEQAGTTSYFMMFTMVYAFFVMGVCVYQAYRAMTYSKNIEVFSWLETLKESPSPI